MKYDAFISYRHAPLDMEIAKKVHTGIETYRIPRSVRQKTNRKKMGRVFRDQEELPIGSDLGDNISGALKESEYLIVICSPRTPESYWVCQEIDTFISMHDRNHILAVLIEGEPSESFPKQLLTDENGEPVEPLAADVRGENKRERNKKFKTELLRLIAPLIGCTYDELKQRQRERAVKRAVSTISAAAAVLTLSGTAFGVYNANMAARMKKLADEKTALAEEITVQYGEKLENQSRFFAEEALSILESGNREDAVMVALEALPGEDNDRPYVPEAEYALSQAVYAYTCDLSPSIDRTLNHKLSIQEMSVTEDRERIVVTDNCGRVYLWNVSDWSLVSTIDPSVNEQNYYDDLKSADSNKYGVFTSKQSTLFKYDYDQNLLYSRDFGEFINQCRALADDERVLVVGDDHVYVVDEATGDILSTFDNNTDIDFRNECRFYKDEDIFVVPHFNSDVTNTYISVIDLKEGSIRDVMLSEGYVLDFCRIDDGNFAVISCTSDVLGSDYIHVMMDSFDKEGNIRWSRELDADIRSPLTFKAMISAHSYEDNGETKRDIVAVIESDAFNIDSDTGELNTYFNLPGEATLLALSSGNECGRVGYMLGNIDFIDFKTGKIYSEYTLETNASIKDAVLLNNAIIIYSYQSPDARVFTWHEAPDIEELVSYGENVSLYTASDDTEYFGVRSSNNYGKEYFFDRDGNELYTFDKAEVIDDVFLYSDKAYIMDYPDIWKIDVRNKTEEKITLADSDFDYLSLSAKMKNDGSEAIFSTLHDIMVFDLENSKELYRTRLDEKLNYAVLSNDGSAMYISEGSKNLYSVGISDGETKEFSDYDLRIVSGGSDGVYLAMSPDDKYIAVCCEDGTVRIADTASGDIYAEVPLQAYRRSYIAFTDDGQSLVMQGDDYKILIFDVESKKIKNTRDEEHLVEKIICDDEDQLLAIQLGSGVLLYETENFGCVGKAENGALYVKGNNSILIDENRSALKRTYYKDYKALIEEAKKQFPGDGLSEEKRIKYNIN